jgi:hypothetical protein
LRKYLIAAGAALIALSLTTVAFAQGQFPTPTPTADISVSPAKAGTKKKPKPVGLGLAIANNRDSKVTAATIQVDLPSTLKMSGAGLTKCAKSVLENQGPSACPAKSRIGSGIAHADLGPYTANPTELTLDVTAVTGGKNNVYFFVEVRDTGVVGLLDGKLTRNGRRLTMSIPDNLKKPDGVTYSALVDIDVDIKKSSKAVTSTGCKARKHTVKTTLTFEANPTAPPVNSASASDTARCSK